MFAFFLDPRFVDLVVLRYRGVKVSEAHSDFNAESG